MKAFFNYCDYGYDDDSNLSQAEDEKQRAQQVLSCYNIQVVDGFSVMWYN